MQRKILGLILIIIFLIPLTGCIGNIQTQYYKQTFDVRVTAVANCSLDGRNLSGIIVNDTDIGVEFTVEVNPYPGFKADEKALIHFKVENYSLIVFKTIAGTPYIRWSRGRNDWYVSGDDMVRNLDKNVYRLVLKLNPVEAKNTEMDIVFYNRDNTWSKSYKLKLWDI